MQLISMQSMTEEQQKFCQKVVKGLEEEITEIAHVLNFFRRQLALPLPLHADTYATVTTRYPSAVGLFAGPPMPPYDAQVKTIQDKAEQLLSKMIQRHRCRLNPSFQTFEV